MRAYLRDPLHFSLGYMEQGTDTLARGLQEELNESRCSVHILPDARHHNLLVVHLEPHFREQELDDAVDVAVGAERKRDAAGFVAVAVNLQACVGGVLFCGARRIVEQGDYLGDERG